ncbi:hypothetical protein K439DRAFT_1624551 [Ramaria rubella]|nr:hypothetical protein K439DRAFT_1624551 [Ramaria rubella]
MIAAIRRESDLGSSSIWWRVARKCFSYVASSLVLDVLGPVVAERSTERQAHSPLTLTFTRLRMSRILSHRIESSNPTQASSTISKSGDTLGLVGGGMEWGCCIQGSCHAIALHKIYPCPNIPKLPWKASCVAQWRPGPSLVTLKPLEGDRARVWTGEELEDDKGGGHVILLGHAGITIPAIPAHVFLQELSQCM